MSWLHGMLCNSMVEVIHISAFISNFFFSGHTGSLCSSGWPQAQIPVLTLKAGTIWPSNYFFLKQSCVSASQVCITSTGFQLFKLDFKLCMWFVILRRHRLCRWPWSWLSVVLLPISSWMEGSLLQGVWLKLLEYSGSIWFPLCCFISSHWPRVKDNTEDLWVRKWTWLSFSLGAFPSSS